MSLEETINNEITVIDNKIKKNKEQQILLKKPVNDASNKTVPLLNYNDNIHKREILVATKQTLQWVQMQIRKENNKVIFT